MDATHTWVDGLGGRILSRAEAPLRLTYLLSWTAYFSQTWRFALRTLLLWAVYGIALWVFRVKAGSALSLAGVYVIPALSLAYTLYAVACLRSIKLILDQQGVWLESGLFPWNRGTVGLRWNEVGVATFRLSFFSWACRSYGVSVSHRFTTHEEIYLPHVRGGDIAAQSINRIMAGRAGAS